MIFADVNRPDLFGEGKSGFVFALIASESWETAKMLKPYIVGIDPGAKTGIAIWSRKPEKLIDHLTSDFLHCQKFLVTMFADRSKVKIFVELPAKFTYTRNRGDDDKAKGGDFHAMAIGGNRREAELLTIMLKSLGFEVENVPPVREKKWDLQKFKMFTKSFKKATQHEMDAARLAFVNINK